MINLKVVAVIPARMASTRFPGKPLIQILGLPMIEHVRRRVEKMDIFSGVYVATCDQEIKEVVEASGGKVIMTANIHERATDRIEEASYKFDADVVVNVQGDEPMVNGGAINKLVDPFFIEKTNVDCTCLVYPIKNPAELEDLNIVKVVMSQTQRLLYLSRSKIPGKDIIDNCKYYKQSGIMAFRKDFLQKFHKMAPTPLEAKESVDLLRILEHDGWVQGVLCEKETKGVDIVSQVSGIEKAILGDPAEKAIFESIKDVNLR